MMAQFDPNAAQPGEYLPQIGTLSGNPVAAVAGLTTLNILKREGTYEKLFATGRRLMGELQRLLDEAEIPARVVGEPPLFDVFFTEDDVTDYRSTLTANQTLFGEFNRLLKERGIIKGSSKFYVSVAHTEEDVQQTIDAMASAIAELRG